MTDSSRGVQPADEVVLLSEGGDPIGVASRLEVHSERTPLHLAFSVYLFDQQDRLLMTRRALSKKTWPGVWTNSCCGHPAPGEAMADAVSRRVRQELGCQVLALEPALPDFRYRAVDAGGVVENEVCPVFVARVDPEEVDPAPGEVAETTWVPWQDVAVLAGSLPEMISPWSAEQIRLLSQPDGSAPVAPLSRVGAGSGGRAG